AFRERLVADPKGALGEVIGVPFESLPRPINVKFIEKEPGLDAMVVLPDFLDAEGSLSDAELEAVAGGLCLTTCWFTSCAITNITIGYTEEAAPTEQ
ncbi:MAG TPA: hypothetical protein VF613_08535, partial [Longimicrobium sp.]